jgi:hypothetical protein
MCEVYLYIGKLFSTYVESLGKPALCGVRIGVSIGQALGRYSEGDCTYCSNIRFNIRFYASRYIYIVKIYFYFYYIFLRIL